MQTATVWYGGSKYTIHNVYNPPTNKFDSTYFHQADNTKTIIAGDFNGHSLQWGYRDINYTGRSIEELCESTNLSMLQDCQSTPTLLHRAHNTQSRPDLTIVSSDLLQKITAEVLDGIGSDHKPTLIKVFQGQGKQFGQKPRWNFKKANWDLFGVILDEKLSQNLDNTSTEDLNETLTTAILTAAKQSIPRGCRKKYKPFWNKDIEQAVNARKEARKHLEDRPCTENKIKYNKASAIAKRTIKTAKQNKWANTCANFDLTKDGKKAWALLNNL